MWAFLSRNRDAGLLVLRLGLGGFFLWAYGWQKLAGGVKAWREYGGAMGHLGIHFWPVMWGFLAMLAEALGSFLVIIGFAFRPACLALTLTMIVASISTASGKSGVAAIREAGHSIELAIVFFSLIFIGPGKYSVDKD
jgi:putative oxidoreductase